MSNNGIQSGKANGVRCGNSRGVRVNCGCAPSVGNYNPGGCGACFPCAFDISFTGQSYRACIDNGNGTSIGIVGSLAGPYRAKPVGGANYSGSCLYRHAFSRPVDSLPDPWPVHFQGYTDSACTTADDGVGLGVNFVELSFGPLMQPILTAGTFTLAPGDFPLGFQQFNVTYWFFGVGDLATSDGDSFTIQNALTSQDSIAWDGNGGGWAWGGSATVSRVGTCAASVTTFGNVTSNAIAFFGGETGDVSSPVGLVNLPAGDYDISHVSGGLRYAGADQWRVNNGTDKFVVVAQDPITLAVTELGDAPGTSTPRDDPDYIDLEAQDEDAITVTHPGGYLGIRLDCASYDGNNDGDFGNPHTPIWCVCIAAATDRNCAPCISITPGSQAWSTFGYLAPGNYTIEYVKGAIQYADSGGTLSGSYQINDTGNSRGFKVRSARWIPGTGGDPPTQDSTDLGFAPGDSTTYATTALAQTGNDGASGVYAHDGGELQIALIDSISSVHSSEIPVTYRLCAAPPTPVDICANEGSDDCPDTVHVSATGGFFDGFEADITRTDTSTHDWGDSSSSYPFGGAYIQCIDGVLTLTFRSDDAGPCTIIFTADGTGACPTGRTWTFQSANEGCDPPTSVSVT